MVKANSKEGGMESGRHSQFIAPALIFIVLLFCAECFAAWNLLSSFRLDIQADRTVTLASAAIQRAVKLEFARVPSMDLVIEIDADILRLSNFCANEDRYLLPSRAADPFDTREITKSWLAIRKDILDYRVHADPESASNLLSESEKAWSFAERPVGSFAQILFSGRDYLALSAFILAAGAILLALLLWLVRLVIADRLGKHQHRDPVTGLVNPTEAMEHIELELRVGERYGRPISLIVFEIDRFAEYSERYGDTAATLALRTAARAARDHLRRSDFLARSGGASFVVLSRETGEGSGKALAEKLRRVLEGIKPRRGDSFTCSFGVADYRRGDNAEALVSRAEAELALSRNVGDGRSKVVPQDKPPAEV
jgi:diguanylate cyclase (GGDEF)-like protein